ASALEQPQRSVERRYCLVSASCEVAQVGLGTQALNLRLHARCGKTRESALPSGEPTFCFARFGIAHLSLHPQALCRRQNLRIVGLARDRHGAVERLTLLLRAIEIHVAMRHLDQLESLLVLYCDD